MKWQAWTLSAQGIEFMRLLKGIMLTLLPSWPQGQSLEPYDTRLREQRDIRELQMGRNA